jgi:hypothetical protein
VKVMMRGMRCLATTEPDGDEIYCIIVPSGENEHLTRIEIGTFDIGADVRPEKLIWNGSSGAAIRFMESDENEPEHGSDDFIGEIVVGTDGKCTPGRCTLDEGFAEGTSFRRFSMNGSGAHYAVQLEIQK